MSQDRFIELVTKEFINELTPDEENELKSLLRDKVLRDRYKQLKLYLSNNYSDHSSDDSVFKKVLEKISQREGAAEPLLKAGKRKTFYWKVAVAAIVTIVSLTVFILHQKESPASQQLTYTKRAVKKTIMLSDGTKVVLNSESKLTYPEKFTGKYREVTLTGEGFFDVARDHSHPFIIHTNKMNIKVLGTAFNVKSYPNDKFSETTLLRGIIEVTLKDRPSDRIILKPSEKLIVQNADPSEKIKDQEAGSDALTQITHFQKKDTTVVETSWMYDKIIFKDETFAEIARRLERAYDVEINFRNPGLESLKFTGNFEKESVTDILKALSLVEPFSYQVQNNKIIIQ